MKYTIKLRDILYDEGRFSALGMRDMIEKKILNWKSNKIRVISGSCTCSNCVKDREYTEGELQKRIHLYELYSELEIDSVIFAGAVYLREMEKKEFIEKINVAFSDKFKLICDNDNSRKEYLESCFQYWKEIKKYISGKRTENMPYISNGVLDIVKEILYKDYYESEEEK
jgi:hypothetical protein